MHLEDKLAMRVGSMLSEEELILREHYMTRRNLWIDVYKLAASTDVWDIPSYEVADLAIKHFDERFSNPSKG